MSELVTGEAVALELRPAKLPSRVLAVVLDLAVAVTAYVVAMIALALATASLDEAAQTAMAIAAFLLLLVGGPIAVETLSHGRSLGKMACGLRVVRDDGGPIRFRHALVRGAVGVVEILMTFGVVACIASLASARGRRLGDVFAGTLVVRERIPAGRTSFVPPPPPWLSGRFSGLDLSGVPDGLWLAVRQYLTRMQQLDPQVGWAMAERLANDVAERTGAPVPPGIPPAAFLAAVMQERQAREARRAFGGGGGGAAGGGFAGGPAGPVPGVPGWGTPNMPYGTAHAGPPYGTPPGPGQGASQPQPPVGHPMQGALGGPAQSPVQDAARPPAPYLPPAPAPHRPAAPPPPAPVAAPANAWAEPAPQEADAERPSTGFAPPA
ncbi:RDD family protein [Streptomyces sp. BH-SS-21]|uniref:RDD family protein n=1 Tax=Streptomyces liliiviolaceus TaxID=2823109 RepID=A0A940XMB9_9ACTN|nr:RDD family protein [Streptomyces liliiviolaceus]MBQ0848614.1 RDD family protein [Streptomyces liliiviolaceus]